MLLLESAAVGIGLADHAVLQPKNAEEMKDLPSMSEDSRDRRMRKKMMNKIECMVKSEMCHLTIQGRNCQ